MSPSLRLFLIVCIMEDVNQSENKNISGNNGMNYSQSF